MLSRGQLRIACNLSTEPVTVPVAGDILLAWDEPTVTDESAVLPPEIIGGGVDEGYGKVADAFRRNFSQGREVGAALAVYRDGRKVVYLWGGYRDGIVRAPWHSDTRQRLLHHQRHCFPCDCSGHLARPSLL